MAQTVERAKDRSQEMTEREERGLQPRHHEPYSLMHRFRTEMDRLFDAFGFGWGSYLPFSGHEFSGSTPNWSPQIESFERDGKLVFQADLPGMTKDDVSIDIEDDKIVIRGERRNQNEERKGGYYHTERRYGSFYRAFPIPRGVNAEEADASFRDGILEITMPLPERKETGRRLEIR